MSLQISFSGRSLDIDRKRKRDLIEEDRLIEDTIPMILIRDATINIDLDIIINIINEYSYYYYILIDILI